MSKVIRALDPKLNPASAEIQSLKVQLSEKEKKIIALEVEHHLFCLTYYLHLAISDLLSHSQLNTFLLFPSLFTHVCSHFLFFTQRECEQAKLREYEEKLIVTAWYNKVQWQDSIVYNVQCKLKMLLFISI